MSLTIKYYSYVSSPGSGSRQPFCFHLQERDTACLGERNAHWVGAQGAKEDYHFEALTDTDTDTASLCKWQVLPTNLDTKGVDSQKVSVSAPNALQPFLKIQLKELTNWVNSFLHLIVLKRGFGQSGDLGRGRGASRQSCCKCTGLKKLIFTDYFMFPFIARPQKASGVVRGSR
jgi:hypothetical protein